jgi:hypothetical protein
MLGFLLSLINPLSKVLGTINRSIDNETEREKARLAAAQEFAKAQIAMMAGPGKWLYYMFAVPIALHTGSVYIYSMLWCRDCKWPQDWTIAAPPPPYGQYTEWVIVGLLGYGAFLHWNGRR